MTLEEFKKKVKDHPTEISFLETLQVIDSNFEFTPTAFTNGELQNEAKQNSGSCKLLAFAKMQGFTKEETLACFGDYYFEEVLKDVDGSGHQNIRNFMKSGFEGLSFEGEPLT